MKVKDWWKRISRRSDMTGTVTYLTKEAEIDGKDLSVLGVLVKIFKYKKIKSSNTESGFIVGGGQLFAFKKYPYIHYQKILSMRKN